ncbi:hypothetical protein [Arenibaculum pallidiluteum]|uniref:hypothetical protein n=1 Tax=Arenibaculum pallidiluteum TaxID=2812559 RepID=UPI001A96C8BE|nr:hypothetical protein [Arenibaculum pallidiluteum]
MTQAPADEPVPPATPKPAPDGMMPQPVQQWDERYDPAEIPPAPPEHQERRPGLERGPQSR